MIINYQLTSKRYLVQDCEHGMAKQLLDLALAISEDHYFEMLDLQGDILYCLARCGAETNLHPRLILRYSAEYLDVCQELDDGSLNRQNDVMNAHTNLAQAYLLREDFVAAREECRKSKEILRACAPKEFPQFAHIWEGWALHGMDRNEEAVEVLRSVLRYREQKYGIDEPPSLEYVLSLM
jgi:hypothetical protein